MSFSHTMPAMLLLAVATAAAGAQPTLDLSPSCSTCRLRFEEVVAFQADWGSGGLPTRPMAVHRFARSHWIVLDAEAATVYRFDERGRYVGLIARRGAGPTEMQSPTLLLDWGADSVAVFDSGNAKALIFGPSGRTEREERVDVVPTIRASRLASGGFLVAGMIGTHAGFGMPFHEYSRQGALVRSFGSPADARVVRPSQSLRIGRRCDRGIRNVLGCRREIASHSTVRARQHAEVRVAAPHERFRELHHPTPVGRTAPSSSPSRSDPTDY